MFNREKLASQLGSHIKYCFHQTLCLGITSADQVSYRGPKAATDWGVADPGRRLPWRSVEDQTIKGLNPWLYDNQRVTSDNPQS